jgi:hypothetical protein
VGPAVALTMLWTSRAPGAEAPRVREFRTQQAGGATYFHVRLKTPGDLHYRSWPRARHTFRPELTRLPQLVPQDKKTNAVYLRLTHGPAKVRDSDNRTVLVIENLEFIGKLDFVGKLQGEGQARFLLLYPTKPAAEPSGDGKGKPRLPAYAAALRRRGSWAEVPVTLDFTRAKKVAIPSSAATREPGEALSPDDLEGQWAAGQADRFAVLEALSPEFGFYGFARQATGRKYRVRAPSLTESSATTADRESFHRRLYETTTGAAAIAESLALRRMLTRDFRDAGARTIPVANVAGIDIAEHPWVKMMAGKKPAPEPLARLVPHDNYYVHFKDIRKFIEWGELMDQWGTSLSRGYEVNSRDYQMKERLEHQLCLRSSALGKTLGPLVVHSLAVTGSDGYLREGSDVTVLFHVRNRALFLAAVDPYIQEARNQFGRKLRTSQAPYHKVVIQRYVTPRREVSLHRASFGDYVVYSNSLAGLRRVIDTYHGRHKALADAGDFRYMRTIFRRDDRQEDGFIFLSDAFIRQLVGPASKIKEKRRLEALTSLYMATHGAMFTAWETGKLPADHRATLAHSGLKEEELYAPEGQGARWDAAGEVAVSDVYNTLHFATPLIEIPIDKITPAEEQEYKAFREEYLQLWRRYFDPVGIRLTLRPREVRVETFILPLINSSQYRWLRWITGDGTITLHPGLTAPAALVEFRGHFAAEARSLLEGIATGDREQTGWLGDWFLIRLDDSPHYARLAEMLVAQQVDLEPADWTWYDNRIMESMSKFPLSVGFGIKNRKAAAAALTALRERYRQEWNAIKPDYRGVTIFSCPNEGKPRYTLYSALTDDGWYVSLSMASVKDLIDRSVTGKKGMEAAKDKAVQVNSSLHLAPRAARQAQGFLRFYLEWEVHRRALANAPLWYALYRGGLVKPGVREEIARATAENYLGFIPVSPDDAAYAYNIKTDEMVNRRHGTLRRPRLHAGIEPTSPLGRLLDQSQTLRADLTFREDGVQTGVTFERKQP